MPEYLSPGIFIEEVPSSAQVIQAVSTSNMGVVGMSYRGPVNTATLVSSFEEYTRIFGPLIRDSRMGLSVAAFFANGGKRAYIVRVVRSDSVLADCRIQSTKTDQNLVNADGVIVAWDSASPTSNISALTANSGASPIVPGAVLRWRAADAPLTLQNTVKRDGTTVLTGDGTKTKFEGRLPPSTFPSAFWDGSYNPVDPELPIVPNVASHNVVFHYQTSNGTGDSFAFSTPTVTLTCAAATWTANDVGRSITIAGSTTPANDGTFVITAVGGGGTTVDYVNVAGVAEAFPGTWIVNGSLTVAGSTAMTGSVASATEGTAILDRRTGLFSLELTDPPVNLANIKADYTPCTANKTATAGTTIDSSMRVTLTGDVTGGSNYIYVDGTTAGRVMFTTTAPNAAHSPILATYSINAWQEYPISKGVWGNDLKLVVKGNPNYYTATTGQYTKFDVQLYLKNTSTLVYDLVETYEELVFDDSTSAFFYPDVINDMSDYFNVTDPGANEPPGQLQGIVRTQIIAAGDESTAGKTITATLKHAPVSAYSVRITYTDSTGTARTISDNGSTALTGDVDSAGNNTINLSTGAIDVMLSNAINAGSLVTATYVQAPAETAHTEFFGDTTKYYTEPTSPPVTASFYTAGSDGVVDISRTEVSSPTLMVSAQGLYALNQVDDIMQVIVPDFPDDTVVVGDLMDYADLRQDRYIILTTPRGNSAQDAVNYFRFSLGRFSKYAAMYWPWVKVSDPLSNNRPVVFPPLGHVAGIYARTDNNKNVGKSPGGTVDGALKFLVGLEAVTTKTDRDTVYQNKINPLISTPQTGMCVWGVRQIAIESEWRYINARRLFMFLEQSVYNATHWVVFENNGQGLWTRIKLQLNSFMNNLFNDGYFAGTKPSEAFFVVCDETNNPQSSIDAGFVIIDVGAAPNKPAEFCRFRFQQKTLNAE